MGDQADEQTIEQRLTNSDYRVREIALIALSTVNLGDQDQGLIEEIYSQEILKLLVGLINDPRKLIQVQALEAIKNLVQNSVNIESKTESEVIPILIKDLKLLDLINQRSMEAYKNLNEGLKEMSNQDIEIQRGIIQRGYDVLSALAMLAAPAEAKSITDSTLFQGSLLLIKQYCNQPFSAVVSEGILVSASRFIFALSKDNKNIKLGLTDAQEFLSLLTFELDFIEIQSNIAGFLANSALNSSSETQTLVFTNTLQFCYKLISQGSAPQQDFETHMSPFITKLKERVNKKEEVDEEIKGPENEETKLDVQVDRVNKVWLKLVNSNIIALQIINDVVLSSIDEENEFEDMSDDDDDQQDVNEEETNATLQSFQKQVINDQNLLQAISTRIDLTEFIHSNCNIEIVMKASDILSEQIDLSLQILFKVVLEKQSGQEELLPIVFNTFKQFSISGDDSGLNSNVIAQVSQNLKLLNQKGLLPGLSLDQIQQLIYYIQHSDDEQILSSLVTLLTQLLCKGGVLQENDLKEYTALLLKLCQNDSIQVQCDSVNAFFDIYSEDDQNYILSELNVIPLMKQGLPFLQEKVKLSKTKGTDKDYYVETLENLEGFIKYKESNM